MNFKVVREAEGRMDGTYQMKISMFGTPQDVGEVTFTPKGGKEVQQVMITDDTGETQKVKIYGGKMTAAHIDQKLSFEIAPNTFEKNNQTYYSGFWNDRATVQQPQGQQATQQATPQFTQRPNVSKPAPTNKDRLIVAQVVYKALARHYANINEGGAVVGDFDIWFMNNLKVFARHIDTIMQAGAGTLIQTEQKPDPF